ncbi:DUF1722 domain-containing protein [Gracilibacillus salinarum]|uniref:DUF1722 domain-containing protein n=1 Tax=Gracilibacillus salinarum TaxID=2932255 RepID=A0ABY4GT85_9BACI|nr:DUF1722 domain-containing protein [Gracilibacillus salinarum]UOQ87360.1 DUF1722 domain-containing protein [Gracilibacillus salinarum]
MNQLQFNYYRKMLMTEIADNATQANLVAFQTRHKYLLMALAPATQKEIGRVIANHQQLEITKIGKEVQGRIALISDIPSRGVVANAVSHMFGYFREELTVEEKDQFLWKLTKYREGSIQLPEILHQIAEWAWLFQKKYVQVQSILSG